MLDRSHCCLSQRLKAGALTIARMAELSSADQTLFEYAARSEPKIFDHTSRGIDANLGAQFSGRRHLVGNAVRIIFSAFAETLIDPCQTRGFDSSAASGTGTTTQQSGTSSAIVIGRRESRVVARDGKKARVALATAVEIERSADGARADRERPLSSLFDCLLAAGAAGRASEID